MKNNLGHNNILVIKAKEDFETVKNLIKLENYSEEIVLFHCQQSIEKALKAYIDFKGAIYPKAHDIETLLSLCIEKDSSFNQIASITSLTPYAIETRYDEIVELTHDEILETVSLTEKSFNFILSKINAAPA